MMTYFWKASSSRCRWVKRTTILNLRHCFHHHGPLFLFTIGTCIRGDNASRTTQIRIKKSATKYKSPYIFTYHVPHPRWLTHVHRIHRLIRVRWSLFILCIRQPTRNAGHCGDFHARPWTTLPSKPRLPRKACWTAGLGTKALDIAYSKCKDICARPSLRNFSNNIPLQLMPHSAPPH